MLDPPMVERPPMLETPPVTNPASRKDSGQSALSYSKFTSEVKIVANPAKVTGLKPP